MSIHVTPAHLSHFLHLNFKTFMAVAVALVMVVLLGLLHSQLFWLACCIGVAVLTSLISGLSLLLISRYPKLLDSLSHFTSF